MLLEVPPPGGGQQELGVSSSLGASVGKEREGWIPAWGWSSAHGRSGAGFRMRDGGVAAILEVSP